METKYLIEFSDILGLEFECGKCHGKIVVGEHLQRDVLVACLICGADWLQRGTAEHEAVLKLIDSVSKAKTVLTGRPFSLRLEIASVPPHKE